jgi:hypothetical protein
MRCRCDKITHASTKYFEDGNSGEMGQIFSKKCSSVQKLIIEQLAEGK